MFYLDPGVRKGGKEQEVKVTVSGAGGGVAIFAWITYRQLGERGAIILLQIVIIKLLVVIIFLRIFQTGKSLTHPDTLATEMQCTVWLGRAFKKPQQDYRGNAQSLHREQGEG